MRVLALGVLLCACQRTPAKPRHEVPRHDKPSVAPAQPAFVISDGLVAAGGQIVRTLAGVCDGAIAVPVGRDRFEVEGGSVDTAANAVTQLHPPAAFESDPAAGSNDEDAYLLVRDEPDG